MARMWTSHVTCAALRSKRRTTHRLFILESMDMAKRKDASGKPPPPPLLLSPRSTPLYRSQSLFSTLSRSFSFSHFFSLSVSLFFFSLSFPLFHLFFLSDMLIKEEEDKWLDRDSRIFAGVQFYFVLLYHFLTHSQKNKAIDEIESLALKDDCEVVRLDKGSKFLSYIHSYTHMYKYIYTYIHMYIYILQLRMTAKLWGLIKAVSSFHTYIHTHTHVYSYIHIYIYTYVYVYIASKDDRMHRRMTTKLCVEKGSKFLL